MIARTGLSVLTPGLRLSKLGTTSFNGKIEF